MPIGNACLLDSNILLRIHDARLAASMYVHGVELRLTLNVRDFRRFADLRVVHPAELSIAR
jgi:predicted nucleic acid-binding protein